MASGASGGRFQIQLLGGPLFEEVKRAEQSHLVWLTCTPEDGTLLFELGGKLGRRKALASAMFGVKQAKGKIKLLLTPKASGPGHVFAGVGEDGAVMAAESPSFAALRQSVVRTSKAKPGGAAAAGTPQGMDLMGVFNSKSGASYKGRQIASKGGVPDKSADASKPGKPTAGDAIEMELSAASDLADAESGEAAVSAGLLPNKRVLAQALADDERLRTDHRMMVLEGGIVSEEEFWLGSEERAAMLRDAASRLRGRAHSRRVDAMRARKEVGMRVEIEITDQVVMQLLASDARLREVYAEQVRAGKMTAGEFWKRYFDYRVQQSKIDQLRRREDAIAGRSVASGEAAGSSSASASSSGFGSTSRSLFAGISAPSVATSGSGEQSQVSRRADVVQRARLVRGRFNLAATAEDAQTGVMAAGPDDLTPAGAGAGAGAGEGGASDARQAAGGVRDGSREAGASAASLTSARGGRGTRLNQRLYEPDDVRSASAAEAVRVRERGARAEEIAAACQTFADLALPAELPAAGNERSAVSKRPRPQATAVDEEAAETIDDLSLPAPRRTRRLVLERSAVVPGADTAASADCEGVAELLLRCRPVSLARGGAPRKAAPGASSVPAAASTVADHTLESFQFLAAASRAQSLAFSAVRRTKTGLPVAMQPAWRKWARESARKGTEVLAAFWRCVSRLSRGSPASRSQALGAMTDLVRRLETRKQGLEAGLERLKGTADEEAAVPVVELLLDPLRVALKTAARVNEAA
jgi:hypothetical protein